MEIAVLLGRRLYVMTSEIEGNVNDFRVVNGSSVQFQAFIYQ